MTIQVHISAQTSQDLTHIYFYSFKKKIPDKPQFPSAPTDGSTLTFTVKEGEAKTVDLTARANPDDVEYKWTSPDRWINAKREYMKTNLKRIRSYRISFLRYIKVNVPFVVTVIIHYYITFLTEPQFRLPTTPSRVLVWPSLPGFSRSPMLRGQTVEG